MRGRGLKHIDIRYGIYGTIVAPHAGAWIETTIDRKGGYPASVAPHAGAWIETQKEPSYSI